MNNKMRYYPDKGDKLLREALLKMDRYIIYII